MYPSGQSQSVDGALPSKTPVSLLQELCMRRGISPKYDLLQIEGPVHEPTFVYRVTVGEFAANGSGQTKKKAKHAAAKAVLDIIIQGGSGSQGQTGGNSELSSQIVSPYDDGIPGNPIGMLQELCMSRRWPPPTYELTSEEGFPHERTFSICATIGSHKEIGAGKSKKLAKRQAAHKMIQKMKDTPVEHSSMSVLADDDDEVKNDEYSSSPSCHSKACLNIEESTPPVRYDSLEVTEVDHVNRKHAFSLSPGMLLSHSDKPFLNGVASDVSLSPSTLDSSSGVETSYSEPNKPFSFCPYQPLVPRNACKVCRASFSMHDKLTKNSPLSKPGMGPLALTEKEIESIRDVKIPIDKPIDTAVKVDYSPTEINKLNRMFEKLILNDGSKVKDNRKSICNGVKAKIRERGPYVSLSTEEKTQHLAKLSCIESVKLQMLSRAQEQSSGVSEQTHRESTSIERLVDTDLGVKKRCEQKLNGIMNGHSVNGFDVSRDLEENLFEQSELKSIYKEVMTDSVCPSVIEENHLISHRNE